jgi:hypothetical protein
LKAAALALAIALATTASAMASEEQFGPFSVRSERPALIYLDGEIVRGTYGDFERARRAAPNATTVVLSSPGGDVDEAMRIARDVRRLDLDTYVPVRRGCYSACAYIFFAGIHRRATGQVGVHQVSDPRFTAVSLQERIADLLDLFHDLGVDARVTSVMLRTPPEDLYVLDRSEMQLLHANADEGGWLDALDDLFGHLPGEWSQDDGPGCRTIAGGVGWSEGCVPAEWIPTSPSGTEKYYFQDAEHTMGLLIIDDPGVWTRDELREVVLESVEARHEDGTANILQEMQWPAAGIKFDLLIYPGRNNGGDVLYQHYFASLPNGGALQVVVYSDAAQAWQATAKAAQVFGHFKLEVATEAATEAPTLPSPPDKGRADKQSDSRR